MLAQSLVASYIGRVTSVTDLQSRDRTGWPTPMPNWGDQVQDTHLFGHVKQSTSCALTLEGATIPQRTSRSELQPDRQAGACRRELVGVLEFSPGILHLHHYEDCVELPRLTAAAGIIRNHPFVDGNKRIGFMGTYIFLGLNEAALRADEISATAMRMASSSCPGTRFGI